MMEADELRLGDERDRLEQRLDDLAESASEAEHGFAAVRQEAGQLETQLGGVLTLIEEHGEDATVAVRGLTAGEFAKVEDDLAARREETGQQSLPGFRDNLIAAKGLDAAPFLPNKDVVDDWDGVKLDAVADSTVGVAKWLSAAVNTRTTDGDTDFRSFRERYLEAVSED